MVRVFPLADMCMIAIMIGIDHGTEAQSSWSGLIELTNTLYSSCLDIPQRGSGGYIMSGQGPRFIFGHPHKLVWLVPDYPIFFLWKVDNYEQLQLH